MKEFEVHIIRLRPMRVASALGFGPNPEELAWRTLGQWVTTNNLLVNLKDHRFFGFNNPNPSHANPNYGYEQWMTVTENAQPTDEVRIKDFAGGLYAVTRCQLKDITETWDRLATWCKINEHPIAHHQMLEECLSPEFFIPEMDANVFEAKFDLYLPIDR